MKRTMLFCAGCLLLACSANASWKTMPSAVRVDVARSTMSVAPAGDWNRWSSRPTMKGEIWTRDGVLLNELSFVAQLQNGETLYSELDPQNAPLPRFRKDMLPIELVEWVEESNRIVLQTTIFDVGRVEPALLGGHDAVRFSYRYVAGTDQLQRSGEAVAAVIDGKFFMVNFVAASTYYFDRDIADVRALVDSVKI